METKDCVCVCVLCMRKAEACSSSINMCSLRFTIPTVLLDTFPNHNVLDTLSSFSLLEQSNSAALTSETYVM